MRNQSIRRISFVVGLIALFAVQPATSTSAPPERDAGYIVVLEDSVERPGRLAERHSENRDAQIHQVYRHAIKGYAAKIPAAQLDAVRQDPNVAYVEPDYRGGIASQTVPRGINRIFAPGNQTLDIDEVDDRVDVDVAVFDTGIAEHADLNVVGRVNCHGNPCEEEGGLEGGYHGTHVAGTIAALDNGFGVVGVAPGARLWSIRVLSYEGTGLLSELIAGIDWVTATREDEDPENDIEVTNASLRYSSATSSQAFDEALDVSIEAGVVHVAAAGNEHEVVQFLPGVNPEEITVSSVNDFDGKPGGLEWPSEICGNGFYGLDDHLAKYSNFGPIIDVAAPGTCIFSTMPGEGYNWLSGTSMASPHVAGAAAILAAKEQPQNASDVEAIRDMIVNSGNFAWDDGGDGVREPLLDVSDEPVFDSGLFPTRRAMTRPATPVEAEGAGLNAVIKPGESETTFRFEYGETPEYGTVAPLPPESVEPSGEPVEVSEWISELTPQTTYHFRVVMTNEEGTFYGADREFTTAHAVNGPTANTEGATSVSKTSATLYGEVNPNGYAKTTYLFEYGKSPSFGSVVPVPAKAVGSGGGYVQVSETIEGLEPDTRYYYRVDAQSSETPYLGLGSIRTFATPGMPKATTNAASSVKATEATLNANVNPKRLATTYQFEYGTTTSYGSKAPVSAASAGSGPRYVKVGKAISGLTEGTTYHYRVVATNEIGTVNGADGTFTTPAMPKATTEAATAVKTTEATLNAKVNPKGLATTYQFEYGTTTSYGSKAPVPAASAGSGTSEVEVAKAISGLTEGATYHYRVVATSEAGTTNGADKTFTTLAAPKATTEAAGSVKTTEATLNAKVNPKGLATTYQFEYGTTTSYGSKAPVPAGSAGTGTSEVEVAKAISGLTEGTTYHYRVVATNAAGTVNGADKTFTTLAVPKATTEGLSYLSPTSADLNAKVNPKGSATTWQLEYGTTTSYGSKAPVPAGSAGSGTSDVEVAKAIWGLTESTTYHYRVVATNAVGTTNGADKTFTTPTMPKATIEAASSIKATGATLKASVNPKGSATTYQFEYALTFSELYWGYGTKVPIPAASAGSGTSYVEVAKAISGLAENTTYHYRIIATNDAGSANGGSETFTTHSSWLDEGNFFEGERTLTFSGSGFDIQVSPGSGFADCELSGSMAIKGNAQPGNAPVTDFRGSNCEGYGDFAWCGPWEFEPAELPWGGAETKAGYVQIWPTSKIELTCESQTYKKLFESITMVPDNSEEISEFDIYGVLSGENPAEGKVSVEPALTYGIG